MAEGLDKDKAVVWHDVHWEVEKQFISAISSGTIEEVCHIIEKFGRIIDLQVVS